MDSDFTPAKRPAGSLQAKLDTLPETPKPDTKTFQTPEEAAAVDDIDQSAGLAEEVSNGLSLDDTANNQKPPKSPRDWRALLKLHWPPGKKEWTIAAVVVLLGGLGIFLLTHHSKPVAIVKPAIVKPKPAPKPTTVPSTLTGLPVDPSVNQRPVTGVMIENSDQARPQSGLGQAGVVFEAVAEGGITRFLALYQDTAPANVGPIRSARPYYIQWALGFNAAYAHVGGSPDALADIKSLGVRDLDEFANGGSYHRSASRPAPHNVYTAISTLNQLEATKGFTASTYTGFARKTAAPSKQPTAGNIGLVLSGSDYNVHYSYVAATNSYNRSEGGAPQTDANTSQQISPKVVVAMIIPKSQGALDASGAYYSNYAVVGSGPVYVFQDGAATVGTWTKSSPTSQITFTDASNQPIKLIPGQAWLSAISPGNLSYSP